MIENALLSTVTTNIFTAPGTPGDLNVQSAITTMIFCNVADPDTTPPIDDTINSTTVDVYIAKNGQTPDPQVNAIIKNLRIPAGETIFFDTERVVLSSGESIWARAADNSRVVVTLSVLPV